MKPMVFYYLFNGKTKVEQVHVSVIEVYYY